MKKSKRLASALAVALLVCVGPAYPLQDRVDPQAPLEVSMIALVATPERLNGKRIRAIGYLDIEFENDALYPHEEDFRDAISKNGIWLRLSEADRERYKSLSLSLVIIEGVFFSNGPENEEYSGAIGKITRLERWQSVENSQHQR